MVNICCLCVNISYCSCIITVYPYCIYFLSLLACNLRDSLSWTSTWVGVVFYSALRKLHSQQISFSYSYHLKSLLSHFVSTWVMTYKLSEMIIVTKSKFSFYYFHGGGLLCLDFIIVAFSVWPFPLLVVPWDTLWRGSRLHNILRRPLQRLPWPTADPLEYPIRG